MENEPRKKERDRLQGERGENDGHEKKSHSKSFILEPQNFSVVYIYVALFNQERDVEEEEEEKKTKA